MSREANRARFPELAELVDATGGKLVWAKDNDGELGRVPPDPASWVEIENFPRPYIAPKKGFR